MSFLSNWSEDVLAGNSPKSERVLALIFAVISALVLSPVLGIVGGVLWLYTVGGIFSGIVSIVVGMAAFVLIVWKSPRVISRVLEASWSKLPEPIHTCIEFGVTGAFVVGGVTLGGIVMLGHLRPASFDWDHTLPVTSVSFLICSRLGWPIGVARRPKPGP